MGADPRNSPSVMRSGYARPASALAGPTARRNRPLSVVGDRAEMNKSRLTNNASKRLSTIVGTDSGVEKNGGADGTMPRWR